MYVLHMYVYMYVYIYIYIYVCIYMCKYNIIYKLLLSCTNTAYHWWVLPIYRRAAWPRSTAKLQFSVCLERPYFTSRYSLCGNRFRNKIL